MDRFSVEKKGGYNCEEVDQYISAQEQVIKSYKDKDNAIKNALISAEIAADNVLRNARMRADTYRDKVENQLSVILDSIGQQRRRVSRFKEEYTMMIQKYLMDMDAKGVSDLYAKLDDMEDMIKDLSNTDVTASPNPMRELLQSDAATDFMAESQEREPVKQFRDEEKQAPQRQKQEERNPHTNRYCRRHELLEKIMPDLATITDEQFELFIKRAINTRYGRAALAEIVADAGTSTAPASKTEERSQPLNITPTTRPPRTSARNRGNYNNIDND